MSSSSPADFAVPPASPYAVMGDDYLAVVGRSNVAANFLLRARFLTPKGTISTIPLRVPATGNSPSDRSTFSSIVKLNRGWLLSLTVANLSITTVRGQSFLTVLVGGSDVLQNPTSSTVLGQDYVCTGAQLGWPGGFIRQPTEGPGYHYTVTGTDPAAGAEVADTVPTSARWRLYAAEVVLVTDATVANRNTNLFIDDAGTTVTRRLMLTDSTNQTASQTRTHHWSPGSQANDAASTSVTDGVTVLAKWPLSLNGGIWLKAGDNIRTLTTGIVAGDNYGAPRYSVEEWLNPTT